MIRIVRYGLGLLMFCLVLAFLLLPVYGMVWYHEQTHSQILSYDGCPNPKTSIGFGEGHAWCSNTVYEPSVQAQSLHSLLEVVTFGVNVLYLMGLVFVGLFVMAKKRGV